MQPLKIVIALVTLIVLAIAIGSNLSPIVTVVVLSQPTVMLPVGVWLAIAIGLGLLSSSAIQLFVWLQSRTLSKKIRQLQSRLQEVGDDVFTYASPPPPPEPPTSNTRFSARDNFDSSNSQPNFTTPTPVNPPAIDDSPKERLRQRDDWEYAPVSKPQPEWEDVSPPAPSPRQQTAKSEQRRTYTPPILDDDLDRREGVYDADFRLIQPPYKAKPGIDDDDDEYEYEYEDDDDEINDDDEIDDEDLAPPPQSPRATPKNDSESEDWGFDFDEKPPLQPPHF